MVLSKHTLAVEFPVLFLCLTMFFRAFFIIMSEVFIITRVVK